MAYPAHLFFKNKNILERLIAAIERGDVSHAWLFEGPDGVGKKEFALWMCRYLETGNAPEVNSANQSANPTYVISRAPDEQEIGIDAVRSIREHLSRHSSHGRYRCVIIDDAHRLSHHAQDALLKIIEEPPERSVIILITSSREDIKQTVCSRLQNLYFPPATQAEVAQYFIDQKKLTAAGAAAAARDSFGRIGYAIRLGCDEVLKNQLARAGEYLNTTDSSRKLFLKNLLDDDTFDIRNFLDAVIWVTARSRTRANSIEFWHRLLRLRGLVGQYNLNPRLQLDALLRYNSKN